MNRTDRLMGIVAYLQSKRYQTIEQLAAHFDKSERTIYRDLKAINEIGVPVAFEPDRGYHILDGYFLPPVSLSAEEANALAILEPLVIRFADKSIVRHYGTALSKIKQVLDNNRRRHLESLQQQVVHYIPDDYADLLPATDYLSHIQTAITEARVIQMEYMNQKDELSFRKVEPIGLTFYSLNWHLIAWCRLRGEYRDFRTSRILSLQVTLESFDMKGHISLSEYLKGLDSEDQRLKSTE